MGRTEYGATRQPLTHIVYCILPQPYTSVPKAPCYRQHVRALLSVERILIVFTSARPNWTHVAIKISRDTLVPTTDCGTRNLISIVCFSKKY